MIYLNQIAKNGRKYLDLFECQNRKLYNFKIFDRDPKVLKWISKKIKSKIKNLIHGKGCKLLTSKYLWIKFGKMFYWPFC